MKTHTLLLSAAVAALTLTANGHSASAASDAELQALQNELRAMKTAYESRISTLENKLTAIAKTGRSSPTSSKSSKSATSLAPAPNTPATARRSVKDNSFNPAIGVVLNAQYNQFSADESEISGFSVGHEGERSREGFAIDHTEINLSANIDDKFFGSTTLAIAEHEGETELELEEAFVQTLPGLGLLDGLSLKAGRAFWILGYLNEHHSHVDDFADRPLPYRVFLDGAYNDDGAQVSYVLPTDLYTEIGGGVFRGDDYPFGEADGEGFGAWSAFARLGNDIGTTQSWRIGASVLSGEAGERITNDEELVYEGETDLYIADVRYTWAPTGNPRAQELTLQGEYFWRKEDGSYEESGAGAVDLEESSEGWYAQAVYKFAPQWRIGARYSALSPADAPAGLSGGALDAQGHSPKAYSAMIDWTNSEFSRVRLQFNREELARAEHDNQFTVQYVMSLGAHGAHKY